MRGKRSKAYRKLLKQFELAFHFHQPYQVLVDADLVRDADRFAMDLPQYLSNTLHGEVKILITQCSMRHLYARGREPGMDRVIDKAKALERRRCGHHPDEFPEPLGTAECLGGVVGPANKHRYVVASQDAGFRAKMRGIPGVPLVYISRSVMILEPMASATARVVQKGERAKFRAELREPVQTGSKRKRDDGDDDDDDDDDDDNGEGGEGDEKEQAPEPEKKKKKRKGQKGPNPLSVKKSKKKPQQQQPSRPRQDGEKEKLEAEGGSSEQPSKKKRKRKQKKVEDGGGGGGAEATQATAVAGDD